MNVQARKPGREARRRAAQTVGNGIVGDAHHDPDVAQLAEAEVEARLADHQVKVALAAYFIAEKRGFEPGHELDDWLAAEAQIASAEEPSVTKPIQPVKAETLS
jgi:hypothetical protein